MRILHQHKEQFEFFQKLFRSNNFQQMSWADIGACRGDTINMFLHFTTGEGQAFEPNPMNAEFLNKEYSANNKVKINHVAVGNKNENLTFYFKTSQTPSQEFDNHYTGSVREQDFDDIEAYEYKVESITLNSHYKDNYPDFVKLDVEGSEYDVLEGATDLLKRDTVWQIEFHKPEDWHKREILYDHGYEMYDLSFNQLPHDCEMVRQIIIKKPTITF